MAYAVSTIALVVSNQSNGENADDIAAWEGLAWKHPLLGLSIVLALFSLAGIPPMAGFFGKFTLLWAAAPHLPYTTILALIGSVIGAFAYLRLLLLALKKPTVSIRTHLSIEQSIVLIICSVLTLGAIFII
jgi:NADH-quinone oxidoreductase subunit N